MSFLIYFFVLLVSAASVLFGLDLMTSPLPNTPNVPIGRSVQVASPPPAQQREARVADERALTPVYPTEPTKPKIQAETSGAATQEQATLTPTPAPTATPAPAAPVAPSAPTASVAQAPPPAPEVPVGAAQSAPAATVAQAPQSQPAPEAKPEVKTEPVAAAPSGALPPPAVEAKTEPAANAQPVTQQAPRSCNVQACGAAYQSFRAADCSYQPAAGPRRACTMTPGATTASAPKPQTARQATAGKDEMREVERIVKHQPLQLTPPGRQTTTANSEMSEVERIVRHMTRGEDADVAVQDGDGNIIVVRKGYR